MRLKDKISLVTGAGSGIGRATSILFAREGAQVICVDIDQQKAEETAARINQENQLALSIQADVTSSPDVQRLASTCEEKFPRLDILVNNAGGSRRKRFEDTTEETWFWTINTNLTSAFLCSKYLLPLMKKSGAGAIVNTASVDALLGSPISAAYAAAKGGIIPLTHVMACDLAKYHIRVNALVPGGIGTGMATNLPNNNLRMAMTPLHRWGQAEEVASVSLFLASDEASFVNGASVVIDGGRTCITQGTYCPGIEGS